MASLRKHYLEALYLIAYTVLHECTVRPQVKNRPHERLSQITKDIQSSRARESDSTLWIVLCLSQFMEFLLCSGSPLSDSALGHRETLKASHPERETDGVMIL